MKKLLMVIPLVLLLCLAFSCRQPAEEVTGETVAEVSSLSAEDIAAIKRITDSFNLAVNAKDWEGVAALYTENATFMPPNQAAVQGRAAIRTWMESFPPVTEFNLTSVEIDGCGDIAFVRGILSMTIAPEGAPEPIQDTGKFIEIRRKQDDGSWLIAVDIFNSDLPLPD